MQSIAMESLQEYDKEEWWDVARKVRPDLSREEYEEMWDDFVQKKEQGLLKPPH